MHHWEAIVNHFRSVLPNTDFKALNEPMKIRIAYPYIPFSASLIEMGRIEEALAVHEEGMNAMSQAFGGFHQKVVEEYLKLANSLREKG